MKDAGVTIEEEQEVIAAAEMEEDVTDLLGVVKGVLKRALHVDGVIRRLHEVAKRIDASKAQVVFLAESVNELDYRKLVKSLCLEKSVPLIDVPDNKALGEWAGLCTIDKDGNPRKVVGASCVCVTDFGKEGREMDAVKELDLDNEIEELTEKIKEEKEKTKPRRQWRQVETFP